MEVPVYEQGAQKGTLQAEGGRQTVLFTAHLQAEPGLYRLTARGREGTLHLAVLEGPDLHLCRRLSRTLAAPVLPLTCALLERCAPRRDWQCLREEGLPPGGLWRPWGEGREVALPLTAEGPFPLTELFCFARVQRMGERLWAVYRFDGRGWPVMAEKI